MPYPGVPKKLWPKMERCVKEVMSQGKNKSSAIAICHDAIMSKPQKLTIDKSSLPQTHISRATKAKAKRKLEVAIEKDGVEVSEKIKKKGGDSDMAKKKAKKVDKVEKKAEEVKKVEEKEEVKKQDEPVEEAPAEAEAPAEEAEAPAEEKPAEEEAAAEEGDAPAEEAEAEPEAEEAAEEEVEEDLQKTSLAKLDEIHEAVKKSDEKLTAIKELLEKQAPAEDVAAEEEVPAEESKEEAPVEEDQPEEEAPAEAPAEEAEEADKVEKVEKSSEGASEEMLKTMEELINRVKKLEDSPAPSKVVMSREFTKKATENKERLAEVEKRLKEIETIRDTKPAAFNNELSEEAIALIKEKKQLKGEY